uniref:uncharacterized protein LOC122581862 n=1 Tax=Erigeron canadensis TaxID=72917 RepID=UPI001CB8EBB4|nr:uncharacterized protein LOC122581862 [Erigeron canadensis]
MSSSPIIIANNKPKRILLLIDLNPVLLQIPDYINSVLTLSKRILCFDSLFSFKFFISSLSPLRSATALRRILPDHNSLSLSFDSPSQTLLSLSKSLHSISGESSYSSPSCSNTVSSLLQLGNEYHWQLDIDGHDGDVSSGNQTNNNLIILLSPVCNSVDALADYLCFDVNDDCVHNLDLYRANFRDSFRVVNDLFDRKDIHFCWIDVGSCKHVNGVGKCDVIGDEIRKFGWGFCSTDMIVLGSALVSFGLVYPSIVMSSKVIDECSRLSKRIRGQLSLEILDVSGKPLECKCCDIELLSVRVSSNTATISEVGKDVGFVDKFTVGLNDGCVKMHVMGVSKYTECERFTEFSSQSFLVQTVVSGKKGKDGLDSFFAAMVLELLAGGNFEPFEKHGVPIWQIFLGFLCNEGYCALVSLSNSKGDSYTGILKPFTIHSAVLMLVDNNHHSIEKAGGLNLFINETGPQGDTDFRKVSTSGKYVHQSDGKRRKMKKHAYRDLTWSSFCKAAYECLDLDLAEVYFANFLKRSKKLKFLKCWMNQVKNHTLSHEKMSHGSRQRVSDSYHQKDTDTNENLAASYQEGDECLSMPICSDQSRILDDDAFASCSGTSEAFFSNLPKMIQDVLESDGVDLKVLAERLVRSSIYWLRQKHEIIENQSESCTMQVSEIIKLLLCDPKHMKEQTDDNTGSTSEYIVREYELQVLLRFEILQSEYAGSITGFMKMKLVKQICSLLEIIQYLVEGGFHGDLSLYDYVERKIKSRYSQNLGDVVDQIYDQMDLLPFGEEDEVQALMFNSEDSNHSWRDKYDRQDVTASKRIKDSLCLEDEPSHPLEKVDTSHEERAKDDHSRKLNEARERRERARRFVSFTSRMPDLQRVWAPKQPKTSMKVKVESKRKKQRRVSYSVVCETPLIGSGQEKGDRSMPCSNPVSKALFQDDR